MPSGVVLIIIMLALALFASFVFYTFNVGRSVEGRVVTQDAADAAAVGGAGWAARSMNSVAMSNLEMARLLAMVNVLDAMPEAVDYTLADQSVALEAVRDVSGRGGGGGGRFAGRPWVRVGLDEAEAELSDQVRQLEGMKALFDAYDIRRVTFYEGPAGRGHAWRAIEALDALSGAALDSMAPASRLAAARSAEMNLRADDAVGDRLDGPLGLMLAAGGGGGRGGGGEWLGGSDIERGTFDDFSYAVGTAGEGGYAAGGLTRQALDTADTRRWHKFRGPYDTVFGWRKPRRECVQRVRVPREDDEDDDGDGGFGGLRSEGDTSGQTVDIANTDPKLDISDSPIRPSALASPWFGGGRPRGQGGGGTRCIRWEYRSYWVYGPYQWLLADVARSLRLRESRLAYKATAYPQHGVGDGGGGSRSGIDVDYLIDASNARLGYLWPGTPPRDIIAPDWETDFGTSQSLARADSPELKEMMLLRLVYDKTWRSDEPEPDPEFLNWYIDYYANPPGPQQLVIDGSEYGLTAVAPHLWEEVERLPPIEVGEDDRGRTIYEYRETYNYHLFVAVNTGEGVEIRNPHNFAFRSDLPGPTDFNHRRIHPDDETRQSRLVVLGVARRSNVSPMWRARFDESRYPFHVAVAQARVFNAHSYDLWTPMWSAQLEPVTGYAGWTAAYDAQSPGHAGASPAATPEALGSLGRYLRSTRELSEVMLGH